MGLEPLKLVNSEFYPKFCMPYSIQDLRERMV
ncbi:Uncharacterised protein [Anaerobiospirillum thomasii]|nr:Uncharacterised protein [Anaerobiospirillum thomasii]